MKRLTTFAPILLATAVALAVVGSAAAAPRMNDTLVAVRVTYQTYDPFMPWLRTSPGGRSGYGIVVDNGLILTTESLVRNSTLVEIRKAASGRMIPCRVTLADELADLALLQPLVETPLSPIRLASNGELDDDVEIVQINENGEIAFSKAAVNRISLSPLPSAPSQVLTFSVLCQANVNAEGAAVLRNSRLLGMVTRYEMATRTAELLPYPILRRFLDDAATPPYNGQASAGFVWTTLADPVKRAYLKAPPGEVGVHVLRCVPGSGAAEVLKPGDIIVEWAGHAIDALGFYRDADFGRIAMPYLINGRGNPGDSVPVLVWRDGAEMKLDLRLSRRQDQDQRIPDNIAGGQTEYLIEGGLIFRELTGDYLRAYGSKWQQAADAKLAYLYQAARNVPEQPGDRVVLLSTVLPDPVNIGYQSVRDARVMAVNGRTVRNIGDIFDVARDAGAITRITLEHIGVDLVLDPKELPAANARIAANYRIPALRFRRSDPPPQDPPADDTP